MKIKFKIRSGENQYTQKYDLPDVSWVYVGAMAVASITLTPSGWRKVTMNENFDRGLSPEEALDLKTRIETKVTSEDVTRRLTE